jgi:hypothetical protein
MNDESGMSCGEHCFCKTLTCMPPINVCCRCGYSYSVKLSGHWADSGTVTVTLPRGTSGYFEGTKTITTQTTGGHHGSR